MFSFFLFLNSANWNSSCIYNRRVRRVLNLGRRFSNLTEKEHWKNPLMVRKQERKKTNKKQSHENHATHHKLTHDIKCNNPNLKPHYCTLLISPSSITELLMLLYSSKSASTSLTLTAEENKPSSQICSKKIGKVSKLHNLFQADWNNPNLSGKIPR